MKVEVSAPDSLREIPLNKYQTFLELDEPTERDIIRIFLNLSNSVINKIPFKEVQRVSSIVTAMFQEDAHFHRAFWLNGVQYGFIPNLDKISFGEYNDLVKYTQDMATMHKAMAVMYRPITREKKGKYLIEEYEGSAKYSEIMKDAPMDVVLGSMVFFFDLGNALLKATPSYLEKVLEKQTLSSENGESITKSIQSLKVILNGSTELLKNPFTNV